jgi:hypothetical protein
MTGGTRLPNGRLVSSFEARETLRGAVSRVDLWLARALDAVSDQPPPQDEESVAMFGRESVEEQFEGLGWDLDRVEWLVDDLALAVDQARSEIKRKRRLMAERQKIAKLRVTAGRAPAEAEQFRRKADELERRLGEEEDDG